MRYFRLILMCFVSNLGFAQDILDPYKDYSQFNPYPVYPFSNFSSGAVFTHYSDNITPGYIGEYEIDISIRGVDNFYGQSRAHAWHEFYPNLMKSYSIELVSFPFTLPCNVTTSCQTGTTRELYMPNAPYDQANNSWDYLARLTPFLQSANNPNGNVHQTLVSNAYNVILIAPNPGRTILPHSVLKHTVNIHCGPTLNNDIVSSFSWYSDNTRGRMRDYPFTGTNNGGGPNTYDIIYFPELISLSGTWGSVYDYISIPNTPPFDTYFKYKTINYFPSNLITNSLNCGLAVAQVPPQGQGQAYGPNYVYPGDYMYISAPPRSWDGEFLAGYDYNDVTNNVTKLPGIKHDYHIDKGFPDLDLTWINPNEKVIYNPSEVSVVSNAAGALTNLVFPSLYTFKTILGVYPSVDEVNDANTVENGGPYADPRDVPVPVNAFEYMPVGSQLSKYPHVSWDDPTTSIDERFGYYYIEENGQITVEPCVKIFDAKFDVMQGGTLIFQDFTQTKNPARFSINSQGGVVARNYENFQYLQNSIVTQTQDIDYIAKYEIYAGENVDPDPAAIDNPYILEEFSNVEMVAGDAIYLQDGFSAMQGSNFYAHCATITQPICPSNWRVRNNATSKDDLKIFVKELDIKVKPNPTNNFTTISSDDVKIGSLELTDLTGRRLLQNDFNGSQVLNLESYEAGIYIVSLTNSTGQNVQRKVVKQ
jgi:hypothetical protein